MCGPENSRGAPGRQDLPGDRDGVADSSPDRATGIRRRGNPVVLELHESAHPSGLEHLEALMDATAVGEECRTGPSQEDRGGHMFRQALLDAFLGDEHGPAIPPTVSVAFG